MGNRTIIKSLCIFIIKYVMSINNSLDWASESVRLTRHILNCGYNPDLHKIVVNIDKMVDQLSKLEVEARRTHKTYGVEEKIAEINSAIDRLEKFILIAKLLC